MHHDHSKTGKRIVDCAQDRQTQTQSYHKRLNYKYLTQISIAERQRQQTQKMETITKKMLNTKQKSKACTTYDNT